MTKKNPTAKNLKPKSRSLYLGVDGGGTKTLAIIMDDNLNLLGEGLSAASNPLRVGIEKAVDNISMAIEKASDSARRNLADIKYAVFGLAGVRREDMAFAIKEKLSARLKIKKVKIVTDAEIALYGANKGDTSLVVIAGTGSICCGRDEKGTVEMAGGWGPIAGDEGGGAGISRRALQAIAKASDGRAPNTLLSELACNYFRADSPQDVALAIYAPSTTNARIAGFAKFVIEAGKKGDAVAIEILDEAGRELGIAAQAVIRKLKIERRKFPIAKVGSIWKAGELIENPFLKKVHEIAPKAFLAEPQLPPATAAAKMAHDIYRQ